MVAHRFWLYHPNSEDGNDEGAISSSPFCNGIATPFADPPSFYEDNPILPDDPAVGLTFATSTPGEQGLDAMRLAGAVDELEALPFSTSLLVMRNDTLVLERYFNDTDPNDSQNVHSASKSMLGLLVGIAIAQGYIAVFDQPMADLLPDLFAGLEAEKRGITVGELLTMSAGFDWTEDVSDTRSKARPTGSRRSSAYLCRKLRALASTTAPPSLI